MTYVAPGWTNDQLDAAEERLEARGRSGGGELTDAGRAEREAVEGYDCQCRPIADARR